MEIDKLYNIFLQCSGFTTDSRKVENGTLFVALKGDNFDGNTFVEKALASGASYCLIDNPKYKLNERCILTDNTLKTLQQLSIYHRQQFDIPILAITGTNGKTTTKELVNAVLSQQFRTHATQGNFNNHLGVPLTLLSMPKNTEIGIIEMGANHPGEIDFLCNIALPTMGLITNVGKAHLAGFGSFEGVINTKTELYRFLSKHNGLLFVNADNDILMQKSEGNNRKIYGTLATNNVQGTYINSDPYMTFGFESNGTTYEVHTNLLGAYNFDNAMTAVCVGLHFGVPAEKIKQALENYKPTNSRSQLKQTPKNKLFLDCYNANPSSMKVAIENFGNQQNTNAVVMLGGMKELGTDSEIEHKKIWQLVENYNFTKQIFVGEEFAFVKDLNNKTLWFPTSEDAKNFLLKNPICNCTILIKGSNSTKMGILEETL